MNSSVWGKTRVHGTRGINTWGNGRDWAVYPHPCTPLGAHFQASVERCLRCLSRKSGQDSVPDALEGLGIVPCALAGITS